MLKYTYNQEHKTQQHKKVRTTKMRIRTLILSDFTNDKTMYFIRRNDNVITSGNWFTDNILDYSMCFITKFSFDVVKNKIIVDLL